MYLLWLLVTNTTDLANIVEFILFLTQLILFFCPISELTGRGFSRLYEILLFFWYYRDNLNSA